MPTRLRSTSRELGKGIDDEIVKNSWKQTTNKRGSIRFFAQLHPILRFVAIQSTVTQDKIEIETFFLSKDDCWLIVKLPVVAMNPATKIVE